MPSLNLTTLQLISVRWWNGSAYYAVSLTEALQNGGYSAYVAGREESPPLKKARRWNLPRFTGINLETHNPLTIRKNLRDLKDFILGQDISLINAHRPEDHLHAALLSRKFQRKIPVIRTASDVRPPKNNRVNRWLHEKAVDFVIFSCEANRLRYEKVWPVFEGRSRVIYGGVDTDFFQPESGNKELKSSLKIAPETVVIGIIGRLSPTKGHKTFLEAAAKVALLEPGVVFVISGEAVEISESELLEQAEALKIGKRLIFLPKQPDVRDVIQLLDIAVVASSGSEAISRIAMECMAMGRPQVVTEINVLPEIIQNGENGFTVPAENPEKMADALLKLIRKPALKRELGRTARKIAVSRFSYIAFAEQTLSVYEQVLKKRTE